MAKVQFLVSDINENELLDENVDHIFEPTMSLQLEGKDVFKENGLNPVRHVIVMVFLESALKLTRLMLEDVGKQSTGEYKYFFTGTGYGLRVKRRDSSLQIMIDTNTKMGPVDPKSTIEDMKLLGETSVNEWVRGISTLSKQLNDRISAANPSFGQYLAPQERQRIALESWLKTTESSSD